MKKITIVILITILVKGIFAQTVQSQAPSNKTTSTSSPPPAQQSQRSSEKKTVQQNQPQQRVKKIDHNLKHSFLKKLENPDYSDKLIKIYAYKEKRVYRINTTLLIDTEIIFPIYEKIKYARASVKNIFEITLIEENGETTNRLIIRTKGTGVSSNLIVITDAGRSYNFLILTRKISENAVPDLAIYFNDEGVDSSLLEDDKNNDEGKNASVNSYSTIYKVEDLKRGKRPNSIQQRKDYLSIIDKLEPKQLKKINLINQNYRIYTNPKLDNPISVFDDGVFTYFKFKEEPNLRQIKIPSISGIENRVEKAVNIQRIYNYLIVKDVYKQYILQRGDEYICVEKLGRIEPKKVKK